MFCPYCGTESTQGLNYCKRCGGNLAPLAQGPAQETPVPSVTEQTTRTLEHVERKH